VSREFGCGVEISLAKCGSSAAAAIFYKRHFKPERLQHFDGSDSTVRFMLTHKRVVPQNDFAPFL